MERILDLLGPFVILFALSVLFRFWASISKENRHGLSVVCAIFWVILSTLALPVTLFAKWYSKLDEEVYRNEIYDTHMKARDVHLRYENRLEDEIASLRDLLEEERQREPEKEFKKGLRNGYIPGYRTGFSDGLTYSQLTSEEKEKLELDAKERSIRLSSERYR